MIRRRTIVSHVSSSDYEPGATEALATLGYAFVGPGAAVPPEVDCWIVDADDLARLGGEAPASMPIIVLTRGAAPPPAERRVVDAVRRPAPFRSLFEALQKALEQTPRRSPRVVTARPARCRIGDETRLGAVVSLSEGGCLFRSDAALPAAEEMRLLFSLPEGQMLDVRARPVHRSNGELGLAFVDVSADVRSTLDRYVMSRLLQA